MLTLAPGAEPLYVPGSLLLNTEDEGEKPFLSCP